MGKFWNGRFGEFCSARKLRKGKDGDVELAGDLFESAADFGNFLNTVIVAPVTGSAFNELKIVNDNETKTVFGLKTPRFGADLHDVCRGGIINKKRSFRKFSKCVSDAGKIIVAVRKPSCAKFPNVHASLGADQTVHELLF